MFIEKCRLHHLVTAPAKKRIGGLDILRHLLPFISSFIVTNEADHDLSPFFRFFPADVRIDAGEALLLMAFETNPPPVFIRTSEKEISRAARVDFPLMHLVAGETLYPAILENESGCNLRKATERAGCNRFGVMVTIVAEIVAFLTNSGRVRPFLERRGLKSRIPIVAGGTGEGFVIPRDSGAPHQGKKGNQENNYWENKLQRLTPS